MSTMSRAALQVDLAAMLMDSADKFDVDALDLCLSAAAADLILARPRRVRATLDLVADQSVYAAPVDLLRLIGYDWGRAELHARKPWDTNWPGRLPDLAVSISGGVKSLVFHPAPTAAQISDLGSACAYHYTAKHTVADAAASTTVDEADRPLLLIRALAEAMWMLAARGITKPVAVGAAGVGSQPANGAPAWLAAELMKQFRDMSA